MNSSKIILLACGFALMIGVSLFADLVKGFDNTVFAVGVLSIALVICGFISKK